MWRHLNISISRKALVSSNQHTSCVFGNVELEKAAESRDHGQTKRRDLHIISLSTITDVCGGRCSQADRITTTRVFLHRGMFNGSALRQTLRSLDEKVAIQHVPRGSELGAGTSKIASPSLSLVVPITFSCSALSGEISRCSLWEASFSTPRSCAMVAIQSQMCR